MLFSLWPGEGTPAGPHTAGTVLAGVHFSALFSELTKILPTVAIKPRLRF